MKKETYYDMCEELNILPINPPVSYGDLSNQTHDALLIFEYLPDNWDSMNGTYLGKDLSNIISIFDLLETESRLAVLDILYLIISIRVSSINNKMKSKKRLKNG